MHVATSPDTVMVVSQNSQLRTHGPSRTEIVSSQRKNRRKKRKAKQRSPKLKPRRLSPCPQQPCRRHDRPNCARFHSETTSSTAPKAETVLSTDQLVKIYGGRAVVDGVNMHVRAGEIVGLLGPNGAGRPPVFT